MTALAQNPGGLTWDPDDRLQQSGPLGGGTTDNATALAVLAKVARDQNSNHLGTATVDVKGPEPQASR